MAGCGNKSKLDTDRGTAVDALWDLAPDGTELGVVASPRAVGLAFRGVAALRALTAQPDLAAAKDQLDLLAKGMFGGESATPEEAGFASDRAFAMFATRDGVLGIMPLRFVHAPYGGEVYKVVAEAPGAVDSRGRSAVHVLAGVQLLGLPDEAVRGLQRPPETAARVLVRRVQRPLPRRRPSTVRRR